MSIAKVTLRFDVLPEEKERLEEICEVLHITKIEFLRRSMAENEEKNRLLEMINKKIEAGEDIF